MSIDSSAGLNTRNLAVHQWAATTYPHIVKRWIEFDDKDEFGLLALNYAIYDVKNIESNTGKLIATVTYYIWYKFIDKLPNILSFGLGEEIAVNAIVVKVTLKEWTRCIYFVTYTFTSEELMLLFDM